MLSFEPTAEMLASRVYHRWDIKDCQRWLDFAKSRDAKVLVTRPMLDRIAKMDQVPNEPFRRFYEKVIVADNGQPDWYGDEGLAAELRKDVVKETKATNLLDAKTFARKVGTNLDYRNGNNVIFIFCSYQLAEACCHSMGLTPTDCGI